jgi:predicted PurR-regulated permease PerM
MSKLSSSMLLPPHWLSIFAVLIVLAWLLGQLSPVLTPFIAAAIMTYILNPLVLKLSEIKLGKKPLSRTLSSIIVMLGLIIVLISGVLILLPVLRTEANLLQNRLPTLIETLHTTWLPWLQQHFGITIALDTVSLKQWLANLNVSDDVINYVLTALKFSGMALLGFVGTVLLTLVLTFYLLLDWPKLVRQTRSLVPKRWGVLVDKLTGDCDRVLGQYLRGQLSVMLALCVYYSITLWLIGFDVALPVGVLTGLLIVIPYLGFALGLLLALAIAVLQFTGLNGVIAVVLIYGFGQILEGFFLTPRWVGASLGLHPVAVIFALLAFGQLLGFTGILLALPLAAVVVVVGKAILDWYILSVWYQHK